MSKKKNKFVVPCFIEAKELRVKKHAGASKTKKDEKQAIIENLLNKEKDEEKEVEK